MIYNLQEKTGRRKFAICRDTAKKRISRQIFLHRYFTLISNSF